MNDSDSERGATPTRNPSVPSLPLVFGDRQSTWRQTHTRGDPAPPETDRTVSKGQDRNRQPHPSGWAAMSNAKRGLGATHPSGGGSPLRCQIGGRVCKSLAASPSSTVPLAERPTVHPLWRSQGQHGTGSPACTLNEASSTRAHPSRSISPQRPCVIAN